MNRYLPLLLLAACGRIEPQLLVPAGVEVPWDTSFDGVGDGLVAVIPVDVMLYDSNTGDPLADVVVEVTVPEGEAGLVGENDVVAAAPEGGVWDARRDRWVALASDRLPGTASYRTDGTGLVRLNVVVDAFDGGPVVVKVVASGVDEAFVVEPR